MTPVTNRVEKLETLMEEFLAKNQAQDQRQAEMMEQLNKLTQAFTEAQTAAKETARKEAIDGSALEQASEVVAGIQRDVVHEEERATEISGKVAAIATAAEETTARVAAMSETIQEEDSQREAFQAEIHADLNKAEAEFNKIEASNQTLGINQQALERTLAEISNGIRQLADNNDSRIATLASAVQNLQAAKAEVPAPPMETGVPQGATARATPVAARTRRETTREPIRNILARDMKERLRSIQRNMKTLILSEDDEQLINCTKPYGRSAQRWRLGTLISTGQLVSLTTPR